MEFILFIYGNTKYTITIDPTVWIFDDRKVDLTTWFEQEKKTDTSLEEYTRAASEHWDREMTEGARIPKRTKTNEVRNKKETLINGTFGIPFHFFIENAEPGEDASKVVVERSEGSELIVDLDTAKDFIAGFSKDGASLKEDGPVHIYYGNGENKENPITFVTGFRIV